MGTSGGSKTIKESEEAWVIKMRKPVTFKEGLRSDGKEHKEVFLFNFFTWVIVKRMFLL